MRKMAVTPIDLS